MNIFALYCNTSTLLVLTTEICSIFCKIELEAEEVLEHLNTIIEKDRLYIFSFMIHCRVRVIDCSIF